MLKMVDIFILLIAQKMAFLENEGRVMKEVFGYQTRMLSREQLHEEYVADQKLQVLCWNPMELAYTH